VLAQWPQITQQWYHRTATRLADAEERLAQVEPITQARPDADWRERP
jgi:hypothetical protein